MMKKLLAAVAAIGLLASSASAQVWFQTPNSSVNANGFVPMCVNASLQYVPCSATYPLPIAPTNTSAAPLYVVDAGTTGLDYSTNKPTLPNVGANFAASGPYASYILITTVPASATRNSVDIENTSGAQIAIIRDDGTAAAAPVNASVFALGGGSGAGAQGGAWSSQTFKGRLQIYSASSSAQVAVMVE
jgi:hypothetical protein